MTNDALSGLDDLSGLNNESELPHLSDAIKYEIDIKPYRYVHIYAGVGSGQNKFINRFINGDPTSLKVRSSQTIFIRILCTSQFAKTVGSEAFFEFLEIYNLNF